MPLDLEAIRKRCEAATKGPWCDDGRCNVLAPNGDWVAATFSGDRLPNEEQAANTAFIAPARTDLPDALDLIAEKDRELTTARARIAGLEAEAGRLRVAAGAYVAALTAVEDGPEGTSDDEFRQQAARVEAGWKALRAALEGKP